MSTQRSKQGYLMGETADFVDTNVTWHERGSRFELARAAKKLGSVPKRLVSWTCLHHNNGSGAGFVPTEFAIKVSGRYGECTLDAGDWGSLPVHAFQFPGPRGDVNWQAGRRLARRTASRVRQQFRRDTLQEGYNFRSIDCPTLALILIR